MSTPTRVCIGINDTPPHELPWTPENFAPWAMDPSRKNVRCRDCDREYRRSRKAARSGTSNTRALRTVERELSRVSFDVDPDTVASPDEIGDRHEYVPNPELLSLWQTVVRNTLERGTPPANLVFFGPSGSGKTEGAQYLAALVGLPFTKVDAASMTDPESWFGTREILVEEGVSVTKYIPSAFVQAIAKPGVVFIDEVTRVDDEHRNVLLPLTDGTGRVTNPLTGDLVTRHPHCFVIMAGNRGLQFTGTSAVDPAFTTRSLTVEFDYITEDVEKKVAMDATGCDELTARIFVRFAAESRAKALADPDFPPISTREVIAACRLASGGLARDLAAKFAIINQASSEGGGASQRGELESIWNGVRVAKEELEELDAESNDAPTLPDAEWLCPTHGEAKDVPAGVSQRTGRPYSAFRACPVFGCDETSGRGQRAKNPVAQSAPTQMRCTECGELQAPGRVTLCQYCGASL